MKLTAPPRLASALALGLGISVLCGHPAAGADRADKRQIIAQARQAYYSLSARGFSSFQASATPNWRLLLKSQLASDPAGTEKALKMLEGIHFTVSLDPDGVVKVAHRADVAPVNTQAAEGFNQIFGGMEQAMSGFFDSWKPFMLSSPFPETNSDYVLDDAGNQYRLTYKDGTASIATQMSKALVISEIDVEDPTFKSSLKPQFISSPQGLVLTSYVATYQGSDGSNVRLSVQVAYVSVNGFQLPGKLNLDGSYGPTPFSMEITLGDYQVKQR